MSQFDKIFSNDHWAVKVQTVGQAIDELTRLPRDMPVSIDMDASVDLVVLNRGAVPELGLHPGGLFSGDQDHV